MRAVVGDVFGNVYLSDISAGLVRRISPNGVISNFAGRVTGTACVPGATAGCTPYFGQYQQAAWRWDGCPAGNIYIADYSTNKVYKVSVSTGLMYLVAGNGTPPALPEMADRAPTAEVSAPPRRVGRYPSEISISPTQAANNIRVVDAHRQYPYLCRCGYGQFYRRRRFCANRDGQQPAGCDLRM